MTATKTRTLKNQVVEYMMPDYHGREEVFTETLTVRNVQIGEPRYLDAGLYEFEITGEVFPDFCDDIAHLVNKYITTFGTLTFADIATDAGEWFLNGYASDY